MHFALIFWGLLRSLQFTIDSIEENILKPLEQYNHTYDIIIHTYQFSGSYQNPRAKESSTYINFTNWKLLKPLYIYVEDMDEFDVLINYPLYKVHGDIYKNNFTSFDNIIRSLNSIYHGSKVAEALHPIRHYDGLIHLRMDIKFIQPLPIELLHRKNMSQTMYLPDFHRSCKGLEYNDRMVIATVPEGFIYGRKLEIALKYVNTYQLHAETFLYDHLNYYYDIIQTITKDPKVIGIAKTSSSLSVSLPKTTKHNEHTDLHTIITHQHHQQQQHYHHPHHENNPYIIREIPYRFQRIRSQGNIHFRDYEAVLPTVQHRLERKGIYYVGKGHRTPWYLRYLYNILEWITMKKVYIWNHDDNGNVFCHPNAYLSYAPQILQIQQHYDSQYLTTHYLEHAHYASNRPHHFHAQHMHKKRGNLNVTSMAGMHSLDLKRIGSRGGRKGMIPGFIRGMNDNGSSSGNNNHNNETDYYKQEAEEVKIVMMENNYNHHHTTIAEGGLYKHIIPVTVTTYTLPHNHPNSYEKVEIKVYCDYEPVYMNTQGNMITQLPSDTITQLIAVQQQQSAQHTPLTERREGHAQGYFHLHQAIPLYSVYYRPVNCTVEATTTTIAIPDSHYHNQHGMSNTKEKNNTYLRH